MQLATTPRPTFSDAVRTIALAQLDGDDIEHRIASLSRMHRREPTSIRHEVDEMVDLLRD